MGAELLKDPDESQGLQLPGHDDKSEARLKSAKTLDNPPP